MNGHDILALGVPAGPAVGAALRLARSRVDAHEVIAQVLAEPKAHTESSDELVQAFASTLVRAATTVVREAPVPYTVFGVGLIDPTAIEQMNNAMRLPGAVAGALMPDAHVGYGLPIGGVMALEGGKKVAASGEETLSGHCSPYAVGVDIGCSMHLSIFAARPDRFSHEVLRDALVMQTAFGKGAALPDAVPASPVLERSEWREHSFLKRNPHLRDRAHAQLGSSGSGNHFASFCKITTSDGEERLALLTHSGSRALGANIANHYSKLAMRLRPELPKELRHLAWLDLETEEGHEYWTAMKLAGDYAEENHRLIHWHIRRHLGGLDVLDTVFNKHNSAWLEEVTTPGGTTRTAIVHRKGATPAARKRKGIIPGSMATPAYVVSGKGHHLSLNSASHGSGRVLSRTQAKQQLAGRNLQAELQGKGITLIGAGLDEAPEAYKDINMVLAHQADLVSKVARLDPMVVRMAD